MIDPTGIVVAIVFLAAPFVLLIVFITKVNSLSTRVGWLEQEILKLRAAPGERLPQTQRVSPPATESMPTPPAGGTDHTNPRSFNPQGEPRTTAGEPAIARS